ncbi:hypothetical protein ON010_g8116 [Phytophthora cinnamomi]|nr:hypothetical protein ON010_g8116 [Phytophthora cinnamomi]
MAAQAVQKRSNEEWLRSKLLLEQEHLRLMRMQEQQFTGAAAAGYPTAAATEGHAGEAAEAAASAAPASDATAEERREGRGHAGDGASCVDGGQEPSQVVHLSYDDCGVLREEAEAEDVVRHGSGGSSEGVYPSGQREDRLRDAPSFGQDDGVVEPLYRAAAAADCSARLSGFLGSPSAAAGSTGSMAAGSTGQAAQQQAAAKAAATASSATAGTTPASAATTPATNASTPATTAAAPAAGTGSTVSATTPSTPSTAVASVSPAATNSASAAGTTTNASTTLATTTTATLTTVATAAAPTATILAPAVRIPEKRDMATVEREYAEVKALLLAKQLETNQKAKAKRDAAKLEAAKAVGFVTTDLTTTAMLTATYKRPLQVDIPGSVKKPRTDSYAMPTSTYQPSTASGPPISPRVAQKFYDLDLATRTTTDSDDKMYLPPKVISKIMYRALPGVHDEDAAAATSAGVAFKREDQAKSKTATPAVSPSHSVHDHETSSSQDTISISDDAVTFMQECVTEFLLYFTSEARDRSIMENRRTKKGVGLSIAGEDVVESMENLGLHIVRAGVGRIERKKLVQQKALEQARAAAAATIAANAAKMAAAGRTVGSPHSYVKIGPAASPLARPVAGTNVATPSRPIASTSAATAAASTASNVVQPPRVVTPTAKPAPAASTTTPKPAAASAAPTSTTK